MNKLIIRGRVYKRWRANGTFIRSLINLRELSPTIIFEENWIDSEFFPSTSWSVFKQAVRTNNDLEGWHNGLNRCAKGKAQLPLYTLIKLLHEEALLVNLQIRLVSDRRLKRHQRNTYKKLQKRLFALWQEYEDDKKNAKELLEACSHLVKPINN